MFVGDSRLTEEIKLCASRAQLIIWCRRRKQISIFKHDGVSCESSCFSSNMVASSLCWRWFLCNWDVCNFRNFKTVVCGHGIDKEKLKYIFHCLMIWPTLTTSRVTLAGILLGGDFDLVSPHAHITLGPVQFWVFKLGPVRFWVFKLDSIKG